MKIKNINAIVVFGFVAFFFSCSKNQSSEVIHPVKEYIPYNHLLNSEYRNQFDEEFSDSLIEVFNNSTYLFSIGGKETGNFQFFGDIRDVGTDSVGNIYVLDDKTYTIRLYSNDGQILSIYGGKQGRGPTDLYRPSAIHVDENGIIYVADAFNKVTLVQNRNNNLYYLDSFVTPKVLPTDICKIDNELFVRTLADDPTTKDSLDFKTIHVYSAIDGTFKRAFGDIYNSPRIQANKFMSGGISQIACIEEKNLVITHFEKFPYLLAYNTKGEFAWITTIQPYTNPETIEEVRSGRAVRWSYGGYGSYISTLNKFNNDYLVVQTVRSSEDKDIEYITHFINTKNGHNLYNYNNSEIDWIYHFNDDRYYVKKVDTTIQLIAFEFNK